MCRHFRERKSWSAGRSDDSQRTRAANRERKERGSNMKYLRYAALMFALLAMPLAYASAQVRVGVGIGVGPGYVAGPPSCAYGYYPDAPYGCAPYGYYGPSWFSGGVFVGRSEERRVGKECRS